MVGHRREEKFRDLIERMKVSKDLTPDMTENLARIVPSMAINAPRIISTLMSVGMPIVDAEDATWTMINMIRIISEVYGRDCISEARNKLAERKRNSSHATKPRKKENGKDAFDRLALAVRDKNPGATAKRVWDMMVETIMEDKADAKLYVDDGDICLERANRGPRRIAKNSFPAIFSKITDL
jgi:hypothetical protein